MTIATVVRDRRCALEAAIKEIARSNPRASMKIMATLELAAKEGLEALDTTKFNPLGAGLYEFKEHNAGIRLFCYYDAHRESLIIIHRAWIKAGKAKRQTDEIEKARAVMAELTKAGPLPFEPEESAQ